MILESAPWVLATGKTAIITAAAEVVIAGIQTPTVQAVLAELTAGAAEAAAITLAGIRTPIVQAHLTELTAEEAEAATEVSVTAH